MLSAAVNKQMVLELKYFFKNKNLTFSHLIVSDSYVQSVDVSTRYVLCDVL